ATSVSSSVLPRHSSNCAGPWLRSGKLEIKAHPSENLHAKVYIMKRRFLTRARCLIYRIKDAFRRLGIPLGDERVNVREILMDDRRVPIDPRVSHGFAPRRARVASNLPPAAQTIPEGVLRAWALVPHAHNLPARAPAGNPPSNGSPR